jgi:hypothetical protein
LRLEKAKKAFYDKGTEAQITKAVQIEAAASTYAANAPTPTREVTNSEVLEELLKKYQDVGATLFTNSSVMSTFAQQVGYSADSL